MAWYYITNIEYHPEETRIEEMFFCPSCMSKAAPVDGKCPVCGHDVNIQNAQYQLPVNCILNGRYVVGKVLGAGGFGITYIGYDLKLDSRVAIKEYYPSGAANRSISLTVIPTAEVKGNPFELGKSRFLKEAKTLSEFVGDGNIVTLRDYFEENGTAYIVMEYLEGQDLSHYARERGRFEFSEALDLLEPVMLALDEVHKKGLIHRDISPSNIMVLNNGKVKVLDFGSARLQNTSGELSLSVMLKPGYAPMEQYSTHGEQGSWTDVYAMSAITALTAQNTTGVTAIQEVSPDFLKEQIKDVVTDIFPDAVKTGMVSSSALIKTIAESIKEFNLKNIVVDPVMIATSGANLISDDAIETLEKELLPLSTVITPNIPEAQVLSGTKITSEKEMQDAAELICKKFNCAVLLKGGHNLNDANDYLFDGSEGTWFYGKRINNPNTHGTGCTLSSAIASNLAKGFSLPQSVKNAKDYISGALEAMLNLGKGSGPLMHNWNLDSDLK